MIKLSLLSVIFLLVLSCLGKEEAKTKKIKIGEYTFQFPLDFKLIKEQGVDSYVGKVSNGKISFEFDYGYYSNSLEKTIPEYFSENGLKIIALLANDISLKGTGNHIDEVKFIRYTALEGGEYSATYLYQGDTIYCSALVPEEIRQSRFETKTSHNIIYKLVENKEYIGLYVKNPGTYNQSINSCLALSIVVSKPAPKDKNQILTILNSCKDLN